MLRRSRSAVNASMKASHTLDEWMHGWLEGWRVTDISACRQPFNYLFFYLAPVPKRKSKSDYMGCGTGFTDKLSAAGLPGCRVEGALPCRRACRGGQFHRWPARF